jgi:serine phosphatase RsbU (regulator of sigma subunit)
VTDGITEARHFFPGSPPGSRSSSFLGAEGLARLARRVGQAEQVPLYERGQRIFEGARNFAGGVFHDDACLLIGQRETPKTRELSSPQTKEMQG